MISAALPKGFSVRAPAMDDLDAVLALIHARDIAEVGEPDFTREDLLAEWERGDFSLATDAWVVLGPEGRIVGYMDVWDRGVIRVNPNTCVHPEYYGRGIGSYLLHLAEAWAHRRFSGETRSGEPIILSTMISRANQGWRLLERYGYLPVRHFWIMEIRMEEGPPAPEWPEGVAVRTFAPSQDERTVHAAIQEAFGDLEGHMPESFEDWEQRMIRREDFDPRLWFVAMDGGEIAGAVLGYQYPHMGWVRQLAVRRPWRRRGLGIALLHRSFGEFYRRGKRRVGLAVDSQNATGATRLYERAGMHVIRQFDRYEKELR